MVPGQMYSKNNVLKWLPRDFFTFGGSLDLQADCEAKFPPISVFSVALEGGQSALTVDTSFVIYGQDTRILQ